MAALAVAACSLTSLEGFSGGDPADAGDADGVSSDAARADDATVADSDAGPAPPFCASLDAANVSLCADFDTVALPAPFARMIVETGGTVDLDVGDFRSSPRSLLFTVGRPSGDSAAAVAYTSSPIATAVSIDMDVRVDAPGSGDFDLVSVLRGDVQAGFQINRTGSLEFDVEVPADGGGRTETETPTDGTLGTAWRHIRFQASATGGPSWNVVLFVDGVQVGATTVPSAGFVGQPTIEIGDGRVFPMSTPWRVRLDNVVVRTQ